MAQLGRNRPVEAAALIAAVAVPFLSTSLSRAIEMKGISYTAWQSAAMSTEDSDASLATARSDGCNWVAICVWWFQDNVDCHDIEPDYTRYSATSDSVVHAINTCHNLGMKVLLKPMVDCHDGVWRGSIRPSQDWFATYAEFVGFWARLAEDSNVEMFCVGCELVRTVSWSASWKRIIAETREVYSGPLTYAANHGNESKVNWWSELDYIGIDAYYPLTNENDPTAEELKTAWCARADKIETWLSSHWPDMRVIFTEAGYQSVDGTNRTPWWADPATHPIDQAEQADCYEAMLSQCRQRDWWAGVFWWNWETDPDSGGTDDPYWTPRNKPAEDVLRAYYRTIPGDFDDDRDVDLQDLMFLTRNWLESALIGDPDLNGDRHINGLDLALLGQRWRQTKLAHQTTPEDTAPPR
jgi:hypothetical protein